MDEDLVHDLLESINMESFSRSEEVEEKLKEFVTSFVAHIDNVLQACNTVIRGGAGHFALKKFSNLIQQNTASIGENTFRVVGFLCSGNAGVSSFAGSLGKKAGEYVDEKRCLKEISKLKTMGLIDSALKDDENFRKDLVSAAVDIFQSFEVQIMSIVSDSNGLGWEKAVMLLAEDAADRCINYFKTNMYSPDLLVTSVLLGKSGKEWGIPFETPGRTIKANCDQEEITWHTSSLFDKVGLIVIDSNTEHVKYYSKVKIGKEEKYGFRRLLSVEKWDDLKDQYNCCNFKDFKSMKYIYALTPNYVMEMKKNLLEYINKHDPKLFEKRLGDLSSMIINDKFRQIEAKKPIWFQLDDPDHLFTGRSKDFEELHGMIHKIDPNGPVFSKTIVIYGLGGIGKTEFVKMYAKMHGDYFDNNAVRIYADKKENMIKSFTILAEDYLGINTSKGRKKKAYLSVVEEVYVYFGKGKSLFIFDNAEENLIKEFLPHKRSIPPGHNSPFILVTSRQKWESVQTKQLRSLELQEAVSLVKAGLHISNGSMKDEIEEMVNKLQKFPLVLRQAIACLNEKGLNERAMKEFMKEYRSNPSSFLESKAFKKYIDYENTFLTTWEISRRTIQKEGKCGTAALEIIDTIAYFSPENISRKILLDLIEDSTLAGDAIRLLVRYSVLYEKSQILSMHSLVQETTRLNLKRNKDGYFREDCNRFCEKCLKQEEENCKHICETYCTRHSREEKERLYRVLELVSAHLAPDYLDHAMSVWNHASEYTTLVKSFKTLLTRIIDELRANCRHSEAYSFGTKAVKVLKQDLGDHNIHFLCAENSIADVLFSQGKLNAALKRYTTVFNKMETVFTINDPNTLNTLIRIVQVLIEKGDYDEALNKCELLINKKRHCFEADTIQVLHERAKILDNLGKHKGAIENFRQVLEGHTENENIHPLQVQQRLGIALANFGEFDKALGIFGAVLKKQRHLYGANKACSFATMNESAIALSKQGKYNEAFNVFEEVLMKSIVVLGTSHRLTLTTLHEFSKFLRNKGLYQRSSRSFQIVIKKKVELLGQDDPDTLLSRHEHAVLLACQGKYRDAITRLSTIYIVRCEKLGENHPSALDTLHEIGEALKLYGENELAHEFLKETYKSKVMILKENHPSTLATENCLGELLLNKGENEDALKIFKKIYIERKRTLGENHPRTLITRNCMGEVKLNQGDLEEAWNIFHEVYEEREKILGEKHPHALDTLGLMGKVHFKKRNFQEAWDILEEVYKNKIKVLGEQHPSTLATLDLLQEIELEREKIEKLSGDLNNKDNKQHPECLIREVTDEQNKSLNDGCDRQTIRDYRKNVRFLGGHYLDSLVIYQNTFKVLLRQGNFEKVATIFNFVIENSYVFVKDILSLGPRDRRRRNRNHEIINRNFAKYLRGQELE